MHLNPAPNGLVFDLILAALFAALIIPPVRLVTIKAFRNRIGNSLVTVVLAFLASAIYLSILGVLALAAPIVLYIAAIPVLFALAYLFWRGRSTYGRSRGLPPGSLALFPVGQWNDDGFYQKAFARHGPIFKTSDLYRPAVCILGIERIQEFLSTNVDAIRTPAFPFGRYIPGGFLRFVEPARHKETRPIFQAALAPLVFLAHEKQIQETWRQELAALAQASLAVTNGIRPKPYLDRAVRVILTRLFFGVNLNSPSAIHFEQMLDAVALDRARVIPNREIPKILDEMMGAIRSLAAESTTRSFAAELERACPGALSDPYFTFNLIFMLQIARNDLGGLIQWICKMLADHPEWLAQVRLAPASSDLPTRIILETIRLEQSEFLIRQTTRAIAFQNYTIPKGWHVRLCVRESHRLSDAFDHPTAFNPDHFLNHRYTRSEYMPFGAFNKTCLGEHLTHSLAKLFVIEFGKNYAVQVTEDAPQEFTGFHWQPSSHFRLRLLPYAAPTGKPILKNIAPFPGA